jgi:diadenosine tetraphosphatase ApaH/serine/threonine PP2A family protein phosphatase
MFGFLKQKLSSFIRFTRDLNKNVFFTCLPKTTQDELNRRFILPDIPGSLASSIGQYFDFVFYLHMHKKDDQEIRALLTQNKDNILAKDRSGRLDMWEKPDLSLVIKKAFNE